MKTKYLGKEILYPSVLNKLKDLISHNLDLQQAYFDIEGIIEERFGK